MAICKSISCSSIVSDNVDFCTKCSAEQNKESSPKERMADLYPQYYKDVSDLDEIDVYQVHALFNINDPSGCIQHASKKLLLSGVRTGGKSQYKDIKEARDTLTRWLQIYTQ